MKNRTCSYVYESGEECGRRHLARSYCALHYQRWLAGARVGQLLPVPLDPGEVPAADDSDAPDPLKNVRAGGPGEAGATGIRGLHSNCAGT